MRCVACLFLMGVSLSAQIVGVDLLDASSLRKSGAKTVLINGRALLVGELISDHEISPSGYWVTSKSDPARVFVSKPGRPTDVPYRFVKGRRRARRDAIEIPLGRVRSIQVLMRHETLHGLAERYQRRRDALAKLVAERRKHRRGTSEWQAVQRRIVAGHGALASWLNGTGFSSAAKSQARKLAREAKELKRAGDERRALALASVKSVQTPEELRKLVSRLGGDGGSIRMRESTHLRVTYLDSFPDARIESFMRLGEGLIELFRSELVEPWIGDGVEDLIPDEVFQEFWLGPADARIFERVYVDWYGASWGKNKAQRIAKGRARAAGTKRARYLEYRQARDVLTGFEALSLHGLCHSLANLQYARGGRYTQDWIEEALAQFLTQQHLGRTGGGCFRFGTRDYGRDETSTLGGGLRPQCADEVFAALALKKGPSIDSLALKTLFDMKEPDLAKARSLFEYVVGHEGRAGHQWLQAAYELAVDRGTFVSRWRKESETLFGVAKGDVFRVLEDRWKQWLKARHPRISK